MNSFVAEGEENVKIRGEEREKGKIGQNSKEKSKTFQRLKNRETLERKLVLCDELLCALILYLNKSTQRVETRKKKRWLVHLVTSPNVEKTRRHLQIAAGETPQD